MHRVSTLAHFLQKPERNGKNSEEHTTKQKKLATFAAKIPAPSHHEQHDNIITGNAAEDGADRQCRTSDAIEHHGNAASRLRRTCEERT